MSPSASFALYFLVLLALFNLADYRQAEVIHYSAYVYEKKGPALSAFYFLSHVGAALFLAALLTSPWKTVRYATVLLCVVAMTWHRSHFLLTGKPPGFFEIMVDLSEASFAWQAGQAYAVQIARALGESLLLLALLTGLGQWLEVTSTRWHLGLGLLGLLMAVAVILKTAAGTTGYPSPVKAPVLALYAWKNALYLGEREPVTLTPGGETAARHILFLVDESIRADHLSLNGWSLPTTPYLESQGPHLLNLGYAMAGGNCSQSANIILQSGLRQDQLPDRDFRALKNPSLFQYARQAGFRTHYLDMQKGGGELQNYMTPRDLPFIDRFFQPAEEYFTPRKTPQRDRVLIDELEGLLAQPEPLFIYANKYGAHFHYDNCYPKNATRFQPTMGKSGVMSNNTPEEVRNSYANAIAWNVDGFFERLLPVLRAHPDLLVVYTSDHAHDLGVDSHMATHCNAGPVAPTQALVPLLLMGNGVGRLPVADWTEVVHRTSHFQLFPTLLVAMGYDAEQVRQRYGPLLWEPPMTPLGFVSGDLFGRHGFFRNPFPEGKARLGLR
ncbi:MAG: sulfatase-like hydrolase/transferase [Magnetococcales bacterium]|nr:sulfatase-like hydrolase/transferase [Magnetococcales bacterium]